MNVDQSQRTELITKKPYRAVIKRQGLGFPLATMKKAPSYFHRQIDEE